MEVEYFVELLNTLQTLIIYHSFGEKESTSNIEFTQLVWI